jgi:outer membrane protein assembly factor BamE (lipoprotein component of BamABCDE complex)
MKTLTLRHVLPLALALALLPGCNTPQARIRNHPDLFYRLSPADQDLIKQGKVAVGFTPDMVKLAVGDPDRVLTRTTAAGTSETWVYTTYTSRGGTMVYYRGYYHRCHPGMYPYWLDYGDREEQERYRVTFRDGKVVEIEETKGD